MEETSAEQQPAKQQPEQPQSAAADSRHAAAAASIARSNNRGPSDIRPIRFLNDIAPHAAGSTLIEWGATRVICGARGKPRPSGRPLPGNPTPHRPFHAGGGGP